MKYTQPQSLIRGDETILATFRQRASAILIDLITIAMLVAVIKLFGILLGFKVSLIDLKGFRDIEITGNGWSSKALATLPILYLVLFPYFKNGKTLGKWIMHIRIVSIYHRKISLWYSLERALGYLVSTGEVFLGFLQIFWSANRMCLHDHIAETIVISEKRTKKK